MELILERKEQANRTVSIPLGGGTVMEVGPTGSEQYWEYRVKVSEDQAIVGFPKYSTIGIGFAVEKDWNSNLPFRVISAEKIAKHIDRNRPKGMRRALVVRAIQMVREAAAKDRGVELEDRDE